MKILTVCQRGNSRSVALAYVFKDIYGMSDALACGIQTTTPETFKMLFEWADKVIVVGDQVVWDMLPGYAKDDNKASWQNIGPDRWPGQISTELIEIMKQLIVDKNLLS